MAISDKKNLLKEIKEENKALAQSTLTTPKNSGPPVNLNENVIDAESNLKPEVLERNLFVLGLDHTFVEPHFETIHNLAGRRNRIAHGEDRRGVPEREYEV